MKLSKRFLATLLATVFVLVNLVTVPVFADFTDLKAEHSSFEAVNVLNKLGVINGYDDGSFKPDNNVTRAEFTAMLLRTRGMGAVGSTSLENPPFPDVVTPDVSWAIGNIRTARELGIVNGYDDGTFKPNNNVSYEEAVKMIVCALGYGEMGSEGAFWYSKYIMTATSLGFLDGAGGAIATPATRATIAQMLYNCLEVKLAEDNAITDKTILENDLNLTKKVGYIASNPELSLSQPDSNVRADELQITAPNAAGVNETITYKVDDVTKYSDMIGAEITFYYTVDKNSGLNHLILATVRNSETIEIPAANILDSDGSSIEYIKNLDDERSINASIASDSVVVYNGKLFGADKVSSTFSAYSSAKGASSMPTIGRVKLIDRNGDKNFDVVFIESYEAWFVSSRTASNYTIVDNVLNHGGSTNSSKKLDPKDVNFKDLQGNASSFSSINTNSVVCIMESNSGNGAGVITTAVICNNAISGTITQTNSKNGYTIGGKTYKVSPQAKWKNDTPPAHGDSGKFYLDCDGNIITYVKSETESNQQYGYVTGTHEKNDSFESSLQVQLVTKSDIKGKVYTIADNAKLIKPDGTPCEGAEIKTQLDSGKKLIKFKTNSRGLIDEIIMAEDVTVGKETESDKLFYYDFNTSGEEKDSSFTYKSSSKQLTSTEGNVYISSSAWIIKVPDSGNVNDFKSMKLSDFGNNKSGYKVEFYDVTTTKTAKVVLVYEVPASTAIGEVKANAPVVLIESIIPELEPATGVTRYKINDKYSLSTEDSDTVSVASTLKTGDMIRVGTDDNGYYTVKPAHIIFRPDPGYRATAIAQDPDVGKYPKTSQNDNGSVQFKTIWGYSSAWDEERFMIDIPENSEPLDISGSYFKDAKIFEIDTTKDILSEDYLKDRTADEYQNILTEITTTRVNAEIFIHMTSTSKVQTLIIVNR